MTTLWVAADYHFPSLYSCRIPMSSMSSAAAMPTPGPATVRLALLRKGMEYFGHTSVREELFPTLCSLPIYIRPPERVGISVHRRRAYKWEKNLSAQRGGLQESIIVREMAQASGTMTIYLQIPSQHEAWYRQLLHAIGYWGQTDSLTCCVGITRDAPRSEECAQPLGLLGSNQALRPYFSGVASEFRDPRPSWEEITAVNPPPRNTSPLRLDIYVWPLIVVRSSAEGKLLSRQVFRA